MNAVPVAPPSRWAVDSALPRTASLALVVGGFACAGLLNAGWLAWLPTDLRLALAFATIVLLPGFAVVALGVTPPGGAWLSPAWALGIGVLINSVLIGPGAHASIQPFPLRWVIATTALWVLALAVRRVPPSAQASRRSRVALAVVGVAAALAVWQAAALGTPASFYSDSPDHIATVRRIMETGRAFPVDAFFKDAGALGVDPRKGIWHPQVALIARLAGVDAATAWLRLSAAIAPLFVLNAAALGWVACGPLGAVTTAWALLVVWAGNLQWYPLRKAVFATFLNDQIALAAATALLWDLRERRLATRIGAVLLAAAAGAIHVYAAIQFALMFGALGIGLWLRDRRDVAILRRYLGTVVVMAIGCAAMVLPRLSAFHAPTNVIHTEPQGLLELWPGAQIVSVGVLWDWMQQLWVVFPLTWILLWRRARGNAVALLALTTSVGVAMVIFNPLAVAWLRPHLGYLMMRMIWMVPVAALLGFLIASAIGLLRAPQPRMRLAAGAGLAAILLLMLPSARDAAWTLLDAGALRTAEAAISPMRWQAPMRWMDQNLPPGQVVLSDCATSYAIPMLTRHFVATLVDQHSSPNDSRALLRILDARDALDPYAHWARTRELIDRHRVTVVVLNNQFDEIPKLEYWAPRPSWYAAARARLDAAPDAFECVFDSADFVVYRVHRAALDTLRGEPAARPYVLPYAPDRFPVARAVGPGAPVLVRLSLEPRAAAPGDIVTGIAQWRAPQALAAGSWNVPVRFDRELPAGFHPPHLLAKPARKLLEKFARERYRFRADHLPTAGDYGVDQWQPNEVVCDTFHITVPADVAEGEYRVQITMKREPHYPNYRFSDYFLDDDYYAGIAAGTFRVSPLRPSAAHAPVLRPGRVMNPRGARRGS